LTGAPLDVVMKETPRNLYILPHCHFFAMNHDGSINLQRSSQQLLPLRKLMGLAVLHWSGMLFSNISVSEVHISFTHTVKADILSWRLLEGEIRKKR